MLYAIRMGWATPDELEASMDPLGDNDADDAEATRSLIILLKACKSLCMHMLHYALSPAVHSFPRMATTMVLQPSRSMKNLAKGI